MLAQNQMMFYTQVPRYAPVAWQPVPVGFPQPTFGEIILDVLGKLVVVAAGGAVVYGVYKLLEPDKRVIHCSACGGANHRADSCPMTGRRVRLNIEKIGVCECCGGRFRYTEAHHYAGRGDGARGKEMCGPCHFHCGHGGDWNNFPINPRYCRLAA